MSKAVAILGDDVSTDVIYPGRYMATVLPTETPQFAFANDKELNQRLVSGQIPEGSVLVGGSNFGCGSSREQAVSTLKGYDLTIVAKGIARIFLQNAINLGLRVYIVPDIEASEGDEIELGLETVTNRTTGKSFSVAKLPAARQAIIDAGGLIPYTRKRVLEARTAG